MTTPSSSAQALNGAASSIALNRLRLDALGSLEADSNGVTTNGGGAFVNNSGATRSVGDVVIYDTTANDDFTTTTIVADGRVLGVVIDASVANGVKGAVQTRGPVLVNVTGSVARGDYLVTSGTAGLAQSNGPSMRPGVFAVALEASSAGTVIALLYGHCMFGYPANQLVNGSLDVWQRGSGPFTANNAYCADRWQLGISGTDTLSISKDTASADVGSNGDAACTFTLGTGGGNTQIFQQLKASDGYQVAGRQFTFSLRVKTATASAVKIYLTSDGTGSSTPVSSFHTGSGAYQTLTVTYTVPSNATQVQAGAFFAASCSANLDSAMLVFGNVAWDYTPASAFEEISRCLRYYYRYNNPAAGAIIAVGQATSTTNAYVPVALLARMGGNPALTTSAPGDFQVLQAAGATQVATAISLVTANGDHPALQITVAANLVAGNAVILEAINNTGWFALEWNP